jgi:hypothetical protein
MIELRYPTRGGGEGRSEAAAVKLDGDVITIVDPLGSGSTLPFATFSGRYFKIDFGARDPSGVGRGRVSELTITSCNPDEVIEISTQGEQVSPGTRPDGSRSVGKGENIVLLCEATRMRISNSRGVIANWHPTMNSWHDLSGNELGKALLIAGTDYVHGRQDFVEVPIKLSPRGRRSALAERSQ